MNQPLRKRPFRSSRASSADRYRLNKVGAWMAAVLAAAVATALAGVLTGAFDALGRAVSTSEADPLTISVDPRMAPCGEGWIVPQPPEQLKAAPPMDVDNTRSWRDWSPAATGVSASPDYVLFFVQGRSNAQVILTGLRVRVHDRRPLVAGTLLEAACGDAGAFRWLEVDLDQDPPRPLSRYSQEMAQGVKGEVPDWKLQPIQIPYKVSVSEAEAFLIVANTQGCDCTWDVELAWATQGRTGTSVINNDGTPFRTMGSGNTIGRCVVSFEIQCE